VQVVGVACLLAVLFALGLSGCDVATKTLAFAGAPTGTSAETTNRWTAAAPAAERPSSTAMTSATTATTAQAAVAEPPAPVFHSSIATIDASLELQLLYAGMWSEKVPVSLEDLRVLQVSYWGFDAKPHSGRLIVNRAWASRLGTVFKKLFDARFPIRRMDPVDYMGVFGWGPAAMDDTMSFNGRKMRGGGAWSMHAYGLAVDIDPLENPYVKGDVIIPESPGACTDRSLEEKGMIHPRDVVIRAFASIGWKWGGDWKSVKDYMHFSSTGR
jgi:hypothetical protein